MAGIRWAFVAGLLGGCMVQPPRPELRPPAVRCPDAGGAPRIGVEFLPPADDGQADALAGDGPRADLPDRPPAAEPPPRPPAPRRREALHVWAMDPADLAATEDPIARETLQFVDDLVQEDLRRARRGVGAPLLDWPPLDPGAGPLLAAEQLAIDERTEWLQDEVPRLLQRPLRRLLRRAPFANHFEVAVDDFRADNVPLSQPYRSAHGDRRRLGRLSVRVHAGDFADPLELVYIRSGVRLGTSQQFAKLSVDWDLGGDLSLQFRARADYDSGDQRLRADLIYRPTTHTTVHLAAGDDLDFLSTSSTFARYDSPFDGSAGVVLYVVHIF